MPFLGYVGDNDAYCGVTLLPVNMSEYLVLQRECSGRCELDEQ